MLKPWPARKPARNSGQYLLQSPPLWVWRATGAGVVLGFLCLVSMARWSEGQISQQFTKDTETLLQTEWATRSDSVQRVVVLGTSLVEYGVADTDFFEQRCGKRVRVVKLYREQVNIDAFTEESPVFQLLLRYPPDVLCIEENLLLFRMAHYLKPALNTMLFTVLSRHLWYLIDALKIRVGWLPPHPKVALFQGFPMAQHQLNREDTLHVSKYVAEIRSRTVRTPTELPTVAASFRKLRQRGVQLVLLNVPRPAVLETVIQGEDRVAPLQALLRHYQQQYQVDYWRFKQPLPFRYFVDYAHLNHLGNPVYSAWISDKICAHRSPTDK